MKDFKHIKADFPIFSHKLGLVYLDSGATSLKPLSVIAKEVEYYRQYSANVFRGVYEMSERATEEYEQARQWTARFIHAKPEEVIFTRNTTESINLIMYSLGRQVISKDSEIVTTLMEHHSNFVPWQQFAFENGAIFKVIDVDENGYLSLFEKSGQVNLHEFKKIITPKTAIFAFTAVSNVLGTINPVKAITEAAKKINPEIIVVIDAAQAAPHMPIDVMEWGADFVAFSSHKMLGPTGVGVLWGKESLLRQADPFLYGGDMIREVTIAQTTFQETPHKFEAGTPHIAGVIAFGETIKYLMKVGMDNIRHHEKELFAYGIKKMETEFGDQIKILGPANPEDHAGILAFTFDGYHPHDIAQILDEQQIAVRAGHHCAMPLHEAYGLGATTRASFHIYNDESDIDKMVEGLKRVEEILRK
jgi:cysteine desulfurase/selenocysteine lyase